MRTYYGSRLPASAGQRQRPAGVAILATLGVLGSLVTIMFTLIRLINLMRVSVEPSVQLAVLALALVVALVVLWINWGFWELIRWAWWANLLISIVSVAALVAGLRFTAALSDIMSRLWKGADAAQIASGVLIGLLALIAYHLIAIVYMLGAHAVFKVGVKDERPIWERVHRN